MGGNAIGWNPVPKCLVHQGFMLIITLLFSVNLLRVYSIQGLITLKRGWQQRRRLTFRSLHPKACILRHY
ncbi:hypothetical protein O9992_20410 [Vibrio lentus]|nr:hypothetical protein [Vibrio lentus]